MIGIRTNRPEYRNDIAEEIRLFRGLEDVTLLEDDAESGCEPVFLLNLYRDGAEICVEATAGVFSSIRTHTLTDRSPLSIKKHEKRQLKLACFDLLKAMYPDVETPWGSLTGIRPTKLFRELTDEGSEDAAEDTFLHTFSVSHEKTALARTICRVQSPVIKSAGARDIDVYIGIPFCKTRCLYCSFASEVLRKDALLDDYLSALRADIRAGAAILREGGWRLRSMYVGGGTPTVLSAEQLNALLTDAFSAYGGYGTECTVEAGRPDTIDRGKLTVLRRLGVARISINPQTMNDATLARIGRAHSVQDVVDAYRLAREIGFSSINMDVIAGLPGEGSADMERTGQAIEQLSPENLTVHALAIKRSSRLKLQLDEYPLPKQEEAAEMTDCGRRSAERMGMRPYYMYRQKYMSGNLENVGYALPGKECVYNIDMMEETVSILSHGAGSMAKRVYGSEHRIERLPAPKDVPTYLKKLPLLTEEKRRFFLD